jgi:hypothetical protein
MPWDTIWETQLTSEPRAKVAAERGPGFDKPRMDNPKPIKAAWISLEIKKPRSFGIYSFSVTAEKLKPRPFQHY